MMYVERISNLNHSDSQSMKILFTGASSFTGFWFIKALNEAGHRITAVFTKDSYKAYEGLRRERIEQSKSLYEPIFNCRFGDDRFLDLIATGSFDVLCCHGADVTNYKSDEFDPSEALQNNTYRAKQVFAQLQSAGCHNVVLTGSVFEGGEGAGSNNLPHFSPYGLSKALTSEVFKYYADRFDITLGRFVIANPFGPYEEKRFLSHLLTHWLQDKKPEVSTPYYIRDNIHVQLLAMYYAYFVDKTAWSVEKYLKLGPVGYVESQGDFTARVSKEMAKRLHKACEFTLNFQKTGAEPLFRANTDFQKEILLGFAEEKAWDAVADYYQKNYSYYL